MRSRDPQASPGKRLRQNVEHLLSTGSASAQVAGEILADASEAGVGSCSFLWAANRAEVRSETLLNTMLKRSGWPSLYQTTIPALAKDGETVVDAPAAFLLPHEVLSCLWERSSPEVMLDCRGLDELSQGQLTMLCRKWKVEQLLPLSLWADGVPYSWDRAESIEAYTWNLPGQTSKALRNLRFPLIVVNHHHCCQATHEAVLAVWNWSMAALFRGEWPALGHDGRPVQGRQRLAQQGKPLPVRAANPPIQGRLALPERGGWTASLEH